MVEPEMPPVGRPSIRQSITMIPAVLDLRPSANDGGNFEIRAEWGYTSMRDLIARMPPVAPIPSPAGGGGGGGGRLPCEIRIRNRLVKQAARAYLQPMAAADVSGSSGRRGTLRRFWEKISCGLTLGSCFDFIRRLIGAIGTGNEL